jgi:hypothetical protein
VDGLSIGRGRPAQDHRGKDILSGLLFQFELHGNRHPQGAHRSFQDLAFANHDLAALLGWGQTKAMLSKGAIQVDLAQGPQLLSRGDRSPLVSRRGDTDQGPQGSGSAQHGNPIAYPIPLVELLLQARLFVLLLALPSPFEETVSVVERLG